MLKVRLFKFENNIFWVLIFMFLGYPHNLLAACEPVVDSDPENYWAQGGGQNVSPYNWTITKSWTELAKSVQSSSNAYFSEYGYQFILNGPTDGSRSPICYKLYINGQLWPFGGDTIYATQACGAYFYPQPTGFANDGSSLRCPNGYTLNTSDGKCYLNDPQLKICPASSKDSSPPDYCGIGNPVNHANGNKYSVDTDIFSNTELSLEFKRFYSHSKSGKTLSSHFGTWSHSLNRSLSISPLFGAAFPNSVDVVRDNGERISYFYINGMFTSSANEINTLVKVSDTWTYSDLENGMTEFYDNDGKLLKINGNSGLTKTLTYTDATGNKYPISSPDCMQSLPIGSIPPVNALRCITNEIGAQLNFGYDAANRIKTITDPSGNIYTYHYDDSIPPSGGRPNALNLLSVTYPDHTTKSYLYGEVANVSSTPNSGILYSNALTGIVDENQNRFASYKYDNAGRAISTEHAEGVEKFTINFVTNTKNDVIYSSVTDSLGRVRTYNFDTIFGTTKSTGQSQPAGSGCAASASAITYDANGNVASRTDFNGNMTTYSYDMARNLETRRTEGLNTAGNATPATRTITTTWHPTWRLPLVTSEFSGATATGTALRITTNVYDAKGNLTSIAEADPVRSLTRTTTITYTYSSLVPGLVISKVVNGPRTDATDTTTYNYYDANATCTPSSAAPLIDPITNTSPPNLGCRGQLQSMTNALGQTTTYNRYNHHGQVEQMTDANGLVTTNTYDLRQRLLSRTVGTQTTSLTYDNAGQVIQLTMPDNSQLNYTYDAAHRLTEVQDTLGNKVTYTLDSEGNRINEVTTDPLGNLAKTITRSYDALNRLQQVTGVE